MADIRGVLTRLGVLSPILVVLGCALLPGELGLQSLDADREMGMKTKKDVSQQIGVVNDPVAERYVTAIGDRLIGQLEGRRFDYEFHIVDQYAPNAFAAPGGYIYVSRGLLALSNREDELAGVIGHEITHVSRRHTAKQLAKSRPLAILTLPGRIVGGVLSNNLGRLLNAPINAVGKVSLATYSRDQESEADERGLALAARAGYDPIALANILVRLEREGELHTGKKREKSFFDSHPTTPARKEDIESRARKAKRVPRAPIAMDRADFLRRLDGLIVGADPAKGVFDGRTFRHPDLNFTLRFPAGWETVNTPTAVGATSPDKDAVIFVGIRGEGTDAKQAGQAFVRDVRREHGVNPSRAEEVVVGEEPGYLVVIRDVSADPPMHLYMLWVAMGGNLFEFIGLAPERLRPLLRECALSFRKLTPAERMAITATRLRVVTARAGETLAELSRRVGNVWDPAITANANDMAEDRKLAAGDLVKVAVSEPYFRVPAP
jgi:predicted Zn-dependent protease